MSRNPLRRISLTTLSLFVAVCEEGTLTRAASREAIAASAVSKRLAELEAELGVVLFDRRSSGMALTPAGETLLHHSRRMLQDAGNIAIEMAEHAQGVRGIVHMLANISAIVQYLPEDLQSFLAVNTAIRVSLEERPSDGIVTGVETGIADIGICSADVQTGALRSLLYRSDQLVVVMRHDDPLAERDHLAFRDTLDRDYIGLHTASSIYTRMMIEARLAGRPLRLRIHVPGFDAVCRMAQAGMGLGILPRRSYELLGRSMGLHAAPLTDPWGVRELRIVTANRPLSPAASLLVTHLQSAG